MKRKTILSLTAAATVAMIGAVAIPAMAGAWGTGGGMTQRMHGQHAESMHGHESPSKRMRSRGPGAMGRGGLAANPIFQSFDADQDGEISADEMTALAGRMGRMCPRHGNGPASE